MTCIAIQSEELEHMTAEEVAHRLGLKLNKVNPPTESMLGWGNDPSAWFVVFESTEP
jgi:hypothetical protein